MSGVPVVLSKHDILETLNMASLSSAILKYSFYHYKLYGYRLWMRRHIISNLLYALADEDEYETESGDFFAGDTQSASRVMPRDFSKYIDHYDGI